VDKLLDAHNVPKLTQEDMSHLNRSIMSNETEAIIKCLPTKKSQRLDGLTAEFYQTFKEELTPMLLKLLQNRKGRNATRLIL
jgi:hypothetical protein